MPALEKDVRQPAPEWRRTVGTWLRGILCGLGWLALLGLGPARAGGPSVWLEAAQREGEVVVYSAFDREAGAALVADFEALHPGVKVRYHDMGTAELHDRFRAEVARGPSADVLWSSAMDLQMKLVNDGYAQPHRSEETAALPKWAVWKQEAFGTTYEPVVLIYNTRLLAPKEVPATHPELLRLLTQERTRLTGRVTTYDPDRSGVGFLFQTQDVQANPVVFWSLARALGSIRVVPLPNTSDMLQRVAAGEAILGYNALGTYALAHAKKDPNLGVHRFSDYTLVMSRVTFIARRAPHPNAARLWVDYVLSRHGQEMLARSAGTFSVRGDLPAESSASALHARLGDAGRPIALGTGLLTYLDQIKRRDFLRQWNAVIGEP
jgi:iron(III) transport system substrate-binding protein